MVEKKTKWTEKEEAKKTTNKTPKKEVKSTRTTKAKKNESTITIKGKKQTFQQGSIEGKEDEKIPTWLIVLFSFSLAFLLFALYKTFVYGQGYSFKENYEVPEYIVTIDNNDENEIQDNYLIENDYVVENNTIVTENPSKIQESQNITEDEISNDMQLIQDFYSYLINDDIDNMNTYVDSPLKNSATWNTHWSKKNIGIFTKHLNDNVSLDNISFVEGSENPQKHTRKYGYTLKYTIDTGDSFTEDWEVTLLTRDNTTLISEIMCKTEGCSRSPFFWPQNYDLK